MVDLQEAEDITQVLLQGKYFLICTVYKLELTVASQHFFYH